VGIHQPFYSRKSHSKNAWWVSTSHFIRQKVTLKMPGGYPPTFFFPAKVILKMHGRYLPAFLFAN
jgi:hypothetical protein